MCCSTRCKHYFSTYPHFFLHLSQLWSTHLQWRLWVEIFPIRLSPKIHNKILPQGLGMDSHRLVRHTSNSLLHRSHLGVCQHRRGQKSLVIVKRLHNIGVIPQVHTDVKDRSIGVLVFFWIITVLDMIASISIIGALVWVEMVAKNVMSYVITTVHLLHSGQIWNYSHENTFTIQDRVQNSDINQNRVPKISWFQLKWLQNPLTIILCRSTMEMLFSVGKIVVVLRLLASHVFWIVSFIKVS